MDGILLIDKPEGITSFKVCDRIKKKFDLKRVGHSGTLDPMATGLLILLIGRATRLFDQFAEGWKVYEGRVKLGESRDTQDRMGRVVEKRELASLMEKLFPETIEAARQSFMGEQWQTAPMYSALKHKGKPLYHYARKGIPAPEKKRQITVRSFELERFSQDAFQFKTEVSKGTYLRTLANDLGERLGTLAYLDSLRRVSSGDYQVDDAMSLDEVLELSNSEFDKQIIPLESLATNLTTSN